MQGKRYVRYNRTFSLREVLFIVAVAVTFVLIVVPDIGARLMPHKQGWTAEMTARHMIAQAGCRQAQSVGLGHARRGQPGYSPEWDGDDDGISCERW